VDATWPETRVVVVEEDEGTFDRVGRLLEFLVPGPHLGGLVFLHLLELRDLAVPDHPQVDLVGSYVGRRSQILVLRPYHRDVPVAEELVHVVAEPRLVSEFDRVRVLADFEVAQEVWHDGPGGRELDGRRKYGAGRSALSSQLRRRGVAQPY